VPFQVTVELGASAFVAGEVDLRVDLLRARSGALQSRLAVVAQRAAGTGVPVISSSTAKRMLGLPEIFLRAARGPTCRWAGQPTARR
jgi:hypothetical protein